MDKVISVTPLRLIFSFSCRPACHSWPYLNDLMEADLFQWHRILTSLIEDQSASKTNQPHQQPSFGDYFYAMTMSRNHSKRRDKYKQYLADEDEFDLHERAKRRRILIGYASAIATIATSGLSSAGKALSNHQGRLPGTKTIKRERLDVAQSCHDMSDRHFHRRYRMDKESLWNLLDIIKPHLPSTGESGVRAPFVLFPMDPFRTQLV
jgi:hypothetical protein